VSGLKHLFRLIPSGSYNIAARIQVDRMKRVKVAAAIMLMIVAASTLLPAYSQPTLTASQSSVYARPGGVYTARGTASAGALVVVEFTASNGDSFSYNFTAPTTGSYSMNITLPEDMAHDLYTVQIRIGDNAVYSSRVLISSMSQRETLQNMIQSIIRTKQALEVYMEELEEEGEDVPEIVLNGYRVAQVWLQLARGHYEDGQYTEALAEARRAQSIFQRAFKAVTDPQPPEQDTQPSPEVQRAREALRNLRNLSTRLAENGYDTTALDGALDNIESLIGEAEEKHSKGDHEGSQRALKAAVEAMNRVKAKIEQLSQQVKTRLATRYRENLENRVEEMRKALNQYQNTITDQDRTQALGSLTATDQKLQRLKETLQAGQVNIDEIQELSDDIETAVSKIQDEETRNTLSDIDKTHAWLQAWRNRTRTTSTLSSSVKYQLRSHSSLLDRLRQRLLNSTQTQPESGSTDSATPSGEDTTGTKASTIDKNALTP
jgi:tetratricopeptide (TPR) repeat protein